MVRRAFDLARSRRAKVAAVGDGADVEHVRRLGGGAPSRRRGRAALAERGAAAADERAGRLLRRRHPAAARRARLATWPRPAATARGSSPRAGCPRTGPGIFGPTHGSAPDIAGQGVPNPSGMLLAAALMLAEGLGERAARQHARARGLVRARQRRRARPTSTARPRRDDPRLHGRRARADAAPGPDVEFVAEVCVTMNGADAVLRSLEAEGVEVAFGIPGGAILPRLRRDRPRHDGPARARAPRAGRRAHGRGLRARVRPRRRRVRHVRPGRDQPRHADRRRVDGLDAARLHHRPGA